MGTASFSRSSAAVANRRGVRELGKDDQADGQERRTARNRGVDHRQHPIRVRPHRSAIERVDEVGLTGGGGVTQMRHAP